MLILLYTIVGTQYLFSVVWCVVFFFFFQAEDGIRDYKVTGVQTCALPIYLQGDGARDDHEVALPRRAPGDHAEAVPVVAGPARRHHLYGAAREAERHGPQIGRASCRERV